MYKTALKYFDATSAIMSNAGEKIETGGGKERKGETKVEEG